MILRLLVARRERAALAWHVARRRSQAVDLVADHPEFTAAVERDLVRARRRLTRADALLDLWTGGG